MIGIEDKDAGILPRDLERERGGDGTLAWRLLVTTIDEDCDAGLARAVRGVVELG